MKLTLNGHELELPDGLTLSGLLALRGLKPLQVAVERNRDIVPRKQFDAVQLQPGDRLEIVTLVGGG